MLTTHGHLLVLTGSVTCVIAALMFSIGNHGILWALIYNPLMGGVGAFLRIGLDPLLKSHHVKEVNL